MTTVDLIPVPVNQGSLATHSANGRPRPSPKLVERLCKVMAALHRIEKRGHNKEHNYDYATEGDIVDAVRSACAANGVVLIPDVREDATEAIGQSARGATQWRATITLELTVTDGESSFTTRWRGQAIDYSDKAYWKAYTGTMKYAILKTFLISTGDDPEIDSPEVHVQAPRPANGRRDHDEESPPYDDPTPPPDPFPSWKAKCVACPPDRLDAALAAIDKTLFTPQQKAELRGIINAKQPATEAPKATTEPSQAEAAYRNILAAITEAGPSEPMTWVDRWVATRGIDQVTQDQHYAYASHIIREWFKWSIAKAANVQQHRAVCEKLTAGVRQLVLAADGEEMDRVSNERGLALKKRKS